MRDRRLVLAALAAASLLALVVSTAPAGRLLIRERNFRVAWSSLTFEGSASVSCKVTIEGTLHSNTLTKTTGSLIGVVNRAALGTCTGGSVTLLSETLPWHVTYERFAGTLPNIERLYVDLSGASIRIAPREFTNCLLRSSVESPVRAWLEREPTTKVLFNFALDRAASIPLTGEAFCAFVEAEHLSGTGPFTQPGIIPPRITLTLI